MTTPHASNKRFRPGRSPARALMLLTVGALVVLLLAYLFRTPVPVGHWESASGHDRFLDAYNEAFQDMPEPNEVLDVRTEFGVVRVYRFAGTGDESVPLMLLPGRASASPVWADNMPSLLNIGDVYTVDLLGEPGMSVQERPLSSDADQAAWLQQVLAALPESEVHLVGLSIGGWSAANLALHHTEHIATLTLIDPVLVFADMPLGTVLRSLPAATSWLPKSWRDSFNSYTAGGATVEEVPIAEMIEAGMQHYRLRLPPPTRLEATQLASLDLPVFVLVAGDSVMHDAEEAAIVAEQTLQHSVVRTYSGASHAVNGEQPEQIAADLAAFITQHGPGHDD